jgi:ketosteroid isomerase-like protein
VESENAQRLRRGYAAFSRGDFDAAIDWMHPEIEWHPLTTSIESEVLRGREAVRAFFEPQIFDRQYVDVEEIVEQGDKLLVTTLFGARGRASGIELQNRGYHLWTIRDDQAVKFEVFQEEKEARAAFAQSTGRPPARYS